MDYYHVLYRSYLNLRTRPSLKFPPCNRQLEQIQAMVLPDLTIEQHPFEVFGASPIRSPYKLSITIATTSDTLPAAL